MIPTSHATTNGALLPYAHLLPAIGRSLAVSLKLYPSAPSFTTTCHVTWFHNETRGVGLHQFFSIARGRKAVNHREAIPTQHWKRLTCYVSADGQFCVF
ncbi:unnamed protein product [Clavelina lepadiformis]|uniref:Uncharacterized protein n=1 Tax=Clavelina lepadiformis TaxID=159417 RepID=A0ABP0G479_CLALP